MKAATLFLAAGGVFFAYALAGAPAASIGGLVFVFLGLLVAVRRWP